MTASDTQGSCAIAIPWYDDALQNFAAHGTSALRLPATEWFLARSRSEPAPDAIDWREWLLRRIPGGPELLSRHPAGPCRQFELTRSVESTPGDANASADDIRRCDSAMRLSCWACAEPVQLATALDHLRLDRQLDPPLQEEEAAALVAMLNESLQARGWTLHRLDATRWVAACNEVVDCVSVEPERARGRDIRDLLPSGRDGRQVRAIMNEMQMLLHEHPVNERRRARGAPAANAVWLWGFGAAGNVDDVALPALATDDEWLRNCWRMQRGACSDSVTTALQNWRPAEPALPLLVARAGLQRDASSAESLQELEQVLFQPLRAALEHNRRAAVEFLSGANVRSMSHSDRWAFWRRPRPLGPAERCRR